MVTDSVMVGLLWAAAVYRVVLTVRSPKTVWRAAFTVCIVGVALGAAFMTFGASTLDRALGVPNLSFLLTHLCLIVSAAATSTYVATLREVTVHRPAVWVRVGIGVVVAVVEVGAWALAPVHRRALPDLSSVWTDTAVYVFNLVLVLVIVAAAGETAVFCLTRAASRDDPVRTVSLILTGSACAAGTVAFVIGGAAVAVRYATGSDPSVLTAIFETSVPFILIVLALGTLSLWIAPPFIDVAQHLLRWRALRPLWRDLITVAPQVHLVFTAAGSPRRRLQIRVQRAMVEIHDALRLITVPARPGATVAELGQALHSPGYGQHTAADLLSRADTHDADLAQLLRLARSYSRSPR